mmetsp:Transcript_12920/g.41292  ORF Transcript_12920/g.41292 Transcript_12920/m.41292 type:complete len:314 (-) Transcript_12920:825-1766(-)
MAACFSASSVCSAASFSLATPISSSLSAARGAEASMVFFTLVSASTTFCRTSASKMDVSRAEVSRLKAASLWATTSTRLWSWPSSSTMDSCEASGKCEASATFDFRKVFAEMTLASATFAASFDALIASVASVPGTSSRPLRKDSSATAVFTRASSAAVVFSRPWRRTTCTSSWSSWARNSTRKASSFFLASRPRSCICVRSFFTSAGASWSRWSSSFMMLVRLAATGGREDSADLMLSSEGLVPTSMVVTFSTSTSTVPILPVTSASIFLISSFASWFFRMRSKGPSFFLTSFSFSCRAEYSVRATFFASGA